MFIMNIFAEIETLYEIEKTQRGPDTVPITKLTNDLYFGSDGLSEGSVVLPVILVERVFDGDNGVLFTQILVDFDNLGASVGQRAVIVGSLEVKIVLAFSVNVRESSRVILA